MLEPARTPQHAGRSLGAPQPAFELPHDIREDHGTSVMAGQLACGEEYELDVIALTTSPAMNAYPTVIGSSKTSWFPLPLTH